MIDQYIYECQIAFPSLKRAIGLVPAEFLPAYQWFMDNEDQLISALPYGDNRPKGMPIPLARQAGIYSPGKSRVTYNGPKFALSVHSDDLKRYPDKKPIRLANGTWIVDYSVQDNTTEAVKGQDYNESLMSCLEYGIPVGVMLRESTGIRVWGLAFVERYNSASGMFTLHGPVNSATDSAHLFDALPSGEIAKSGNAIPQGSNDDERQRFAQQRIRSRQDVFRRELLDAYGGACAITQTNVPEVLQAAHIEPYRGAASQIACNGILLRSDLHLLYDAHLMSITPETYEIRLAERLEHTSYKRYNGRTIHLPSDRRARPDNDLLALQYEQFSTENKVLDLP